MEWLKGKNTILEDKIPSKNIRNIDYKTGI